RKIWQPTGSPLLTHLVNLAGKVGRLLPEMLVLPAMRYGRPSIASALKRMAAEGVTRLIVLPLYPQFSLAATESSEREVRRVASKVLPGARVEIRGAFYDDPRYLDAVVEVSQPHFQKDWFTLFSFHGLPERQVKKTDITGQVCCKRDDCCDKVGAVNSLCYRAQSFATARTLAKMLGIAPDRWTIGFQSRLGRTPWIQPYSDVLYETLPSDGIRHLNVLTPSFTADCLETLEEVAIRGQEAFHKAGGETLKLIPSLNDHPAWAEAVRRIAVEPAYQPIT
ncbi:ferrochelatase, partial [bacterium]|nr:ferrochelatase [bacterium]